MNNPDKTTFADKVIAFNRNLKLDSKLPGGIKGFIRYAESVGEMGNRVRHTMTENR